MKLENAGFRRERASGAIFHHAARDLRLVVHGDEFSFLGYAGDLDCVESEMHSWCDVVTAQMRKYVEPSSCLRCHLLALSWRRMESTVDIAPLPCHLSKMELTVLIH